MAIVTRIPCTGQAVNQDHWNRRTGHRPITAVLSESRYHGSVTDQAHWCCLALSPPDGIRSHCDLCHLFRTAVGIIQYIN